MSAERRVSTHHEQPSARRRVSEVCHINGEENQRGPFSGTIRARGACVFVQS